MIIENYNQKLSILFEDRDILLADKPSGMMVHTNAWERDAPNCVNTLAGMIGKRVYNVHRLDRGTSGVLVFALDSDTARTLAESFRNREVKKRYIAVVRGHLTEPVTVDTPLRKPKGDTFPAVTHIRPLAHTVIDEPVGPYQEAWYSLVEVELETGRRHQARRHLNYIAHPVIGDRQHGDSRNNRLFSRLFGSQGLLLRAMELEFDHPTRPVRIRAEAGLPTWWRELLEMTRLARPEGFSAIPRVQELPESPPLAGPLW